MAEPNAHVGQAVEVRRLNARMPRASKVVMTQLVIHNKQNIHAQTLASQQGAD